MFLLDLEALYKQSKPCFSIKKIKKLKAEKVKLIALFKNTRPNSEVQKQQNRKVSMTICNFDGFKLSSV